jgi:hypothetical protein
MVLILIMFLSSPHELNMSIHYVLLQLFQMHQTGIVTGILQSNLLQRNDIARAFSSNIEQKLSGVNNIVNFTTDWLCNS